MALLPILHYPDPRLLKVARPVLAVDGAIRKLVSDMTQTLYAAPGVGLAATQVDAHVRVVVIDISPEKNDLRVLINPRLTHSAGEAIGEEGCLSVPGIYEKVKRATTVGVQAMDMDGREFSFEAHGLLAVCVQHEIDHLNGKVFVEHLSRLKQGRIKAKIAKQSRITV
jgi:peptide deformylase